MKYALFLLVALSLVVGSLSVCRTGTVARTPPTNNICSGEVDTCQNADCCSRVATQCRAASVDNNKVCTSAKYRDMGKQGMEAGTTDASYDAACCTAKATCAQFTCPAGSTAKTSAAATACTSNVASCAPQTCCDVTATSCLAKSGSMTCPSTKYADSTKWGAVAGSTSTSYDTACCTTKATCGQFTCPAPFATVASAATTACTGAASTCSILSCCGAPTGSCLEKQLQLSTCATGRTAAGVSLGNQAGGTTASYNTNCCAPKATCTDYFTYVASTTSSVAAVRPTMMVLLVAAVVGTVASLQ